MELSDWRDSLRFDYQHQLASEPLRIDLVIIKKPGDMDIGKNIARIFKGHNVLEYKSPDDYLSANDFLKVYAYACLYAEMTPGVDFSDITLTFVESRHPRKLLQYLSEARGYAVEETSPGIYRVSGDYLPVQVIESKRLPESENIWLKSLANDLESRSMGAILRASSGHKERLGAYLDAIIKANYKTFLEVYGMLIDTLDEIFAEAGIVPEWIERGRAQGIEQGRVQGIEQGIKQDKLEIARNFKKMGLPISQIAEGTGLTTEAIEQL